MGALLSAGTWSGKIRLHFRLPDHGPFAPELAALEFDPAEFRDDEVRVLIRDIDETLLGLQANHADGFLGQFRDADNDADHIAGLDAVIAAYTESQARHAR